MLLRETVRHCATCGEAPPHSYRGLPSARALALLLAIAALGCAIAGTWIAAAVCAFAASAVWLTDRERCWDIACLRCLTRRLEALGRTRPKLGSTTRIDPF